MELVIVYLAVVVLAVLLGLKAFDAARAWRFNRRRAHREAVLAAYNRGFQEAVGAYARAQTYRVVRITPSRPEPTSYWAGKTVDEICDSLQRPASERFGDLGGQP